MKAVVVEFKNGLAAVLSDDGCIVTVKNNNYEIGQVIQISSPNINFTKKIATFTASAAAFVVLSVGAWAYASPYSYVSVDVNPSIEFTVNRFDRVLRVKAVNDDGAAILKEISLNNLNNKTIGEALTRTVDQLSESGYLDRAIEGDIVITTSGKNSEKSETLAQELQLTAEKKVAENGDDIEVKAFSVKPEPVIDRVSEKANKFAEKAAQKSIAAADKAKAADEKAKTAKEKATAAQEKAKIAEDKAIVAEDNSKAATENAKNVTEKENKSDNSSVKDKDRAESAEKDARKAKKDARKAKDDAKKAKDDAKKSTEKAKKAIVEADKTEKDANKAKEDANKAKEDANKAKEDANKATVGTTNNSKGFNNASDRDSDKSSRDSNRVSDKSNNSSDKDTKNTNSNHGISSVGGNK